MSSLVQAKTLEEARKELGQLGIEYSTHAFLKCVYEGDKVAVDLFLSAGMDVNAKGEKGYTALNLAVSKGNTNLVNTLLAKGANVNDESDDGFTALVLACSLNHTGIATTLVDKGAAGKCAAGGEPALLGYTAQPD